MFTIDDLLDKIDVFIDREDQDYYTEIEVIEVRHLTEKAVLVVNAGGDFIGWIPFSLMRCDEAKNIFVEHWFYNRNF